jgi:hypothetical protein
MTPLFLIVRVVLAAALILKDEPMWVLKAVQQTKHLSIKPILVGLYLLPLILAGHLSIVLTDTFTYSATQLNLLQGLP